MIHRNAAYRAPFKIGSLKTIDQTHDIVCATCSLPVENYFGVILGSLVVGMTENSIILFENALTSSFGWHEKDLSEYHSKIDHQLNQ